MVGCGKRDVLRVDWAVKRTNNKLSECSCTCRRHKFQGRLEMLEGFCGATRYSKRYIIASAMMIKIRDDQCCVEYLVVPPSIVRLKPVQS
jgi:hypothetical protein